MEEKMIPDKKTARIAGVLYLAVGLFSGFTFMVRSNLIVQGGVSKTIGNITNSELLFRVSLLSDLIGQIFFVLTVLILFKIFQTVNKNHSLVMFVFALIPVPIVFTNLVGQFTMLQYINTADQTFNPDQLHSQILFFLNLHDNGVYIAQIFWGLWLFPLGYLVFKSDFIPKTIGILLIIAGLGYVTDSFGKCLLAGYDISISQFTFIGEFVLIFWLLIKGIKTQQT